MRKNLVKGMAALCMCAAFASCSHDTDFESAHQSVVFDNLKNQYSANFIKMYGPIDPNQSWDFTSNVNASQARTRANEGFSKEMAQEGSSFFSFVKFDYDAIKGLLNADSYQGTYTQTSGSWIWQTKKTYTVSATARLIDWVNTIQVKLTPTYAHSNYVSGDNRYFHIGFVYNNNEPEEMIANIKVKGYGSDHWYEALKGTLDHHTSRQINTIPAAGNGYWCTYYTKADGVSAQKFKLTQISQVREIKVNVSEQDERVYWGFDCDNDGNFSDVICLVREFSTPDPIIKRYMIEDLGTTDDYDFNDIVVDFKDDLQGHQTAKIRAMGGTLDFTLNVAGQAVWTKSVNGPVLTPAVNIKNMVNTDPNEIDYTKVIAEFPISGWIPNDNNISVTVKYSDENSETGSSFYTIPFPEVGKVPMMFATDILVPWMEERINFPQWWLLNFQGEEVVE